MSLRTASTELKRCRQGDMSQKFRQISSTVVVCLCGLLRLSWNVVGSKTSFTIVLSKCLLQSSHVFAVCVDSMQDNLWFLMCCVALHVFANCIQMYGRKLGCLIETGTQVARATWVPVSISHPSFFLDDFFFAVLRSAHVEKKGSSKCEGLKHVTHNLYWHMFFWIIYFLPFETSATASCGSTGIL